MGCQNDASATVGRQAGCEVSPAAALAAARTAQAALSALAALAAAAGAPGPAARYITVEDAAAVMSMSPSTVARLVEAGRLPVCRIPPALPGNGARRAKPMIRIDVRDIDAFMRRDKRIA